MCRATPFVALSCACGLLSGLPTRAADWPLFGGTPQRNHVNTVEKNLPATWGVEKGRERNLKWVARLGSVSYGGPVIGGGKVFLGTNNQLPRNPKIQGDKGVLMCFRESDGRFLWQAVHDKLPSGLVNDWPQQGVVSMPAVEGNRLYYVSNRCELVCADTEGFLDGKNDGTQDEQYKGPTEADIIWRLDMIKELKVFPHNLAICSPLIAGDLVFVVTGNGVDEDHIRIPAPDAPSFLAVDKKTGKVLWKDNSPGKNIMHGQWSNPAYAVVRGKPQVVFPGGDGWLYAFEPDTGKLLWKFDCNPKDSKYDLGGKGTKNDFIGTPVVVENKVYIGVGQDPEHSEGVGHFWCIDMTKAGDDSPELVTDGSVFPPKTKNNPNSALVWHYGGPAKGENRTRDYVFGRTISTAAVHDGLVYIAELAGYLHCLDARTGKGHWDHDLKAAVWGSAYWADGKVYVGNEDGDVYVFAHGREKRLLGKIEMEHSIKGTPVAANGVLYLATEGNLYALAPK